MDHRNSGSRMAFLAILKIVSPGHPHQWVQLEHMLKHRIKEAQLSWKDPSMLRVVEYFAKSLKVTR